MSTLETQTQKPSEAKPSGPAVVALSRKRKKTEGRKKRAMKLKTDGAFAKAYFEGKSKRSAEKKSAYRKKKSKKK